VGCLSLEESHKEDGCRSDGSTNGQGVKSSIAHKTNVDLGSWRCNMYRGGHICGYVWWRRRRRERKSCQNVSIGIGAVAGKGGVLPRHASLGLRNIADLNETVAALRTSQRRLRRINAADAIDGVDVASARDCADHKQSVVVKCAIKEEHITAPNKCSFLAKPLEERNGRGLVRRSLVSGDGDDRAFTNPGRRNQRISEFCWSKATAKIIVIQMKVDLVGDCNVKIGDQGNSAIGRIAIGKEMIDYTIRGTAKLDKGPSIVHLGGDALVLNEQDLVQLVFKGIDADEFDHLFSSGHEEQFIYNRGRSPNQPV